MNEDETFIRAIVDNPGDDTSRLVYADWLDDRDDPRGMYLRAEQAAVASGDVTRIRELAVGLDAVWVARVSLLPIGVCCDGFTWSQCGTPISGADLDRFEMRFGIELPPQYRAFLLNYNGGVIELDPRETPDGIVNHYPCIFYSLAGTSGDDPRFSLEYELAVRAASLFAGTPRGESGLRVRLRNSMIIGTTVEQMEWVLLGLGRKNAGRIRIFPVFAYGGDRPAGPQRFDSLAEYLLFLREYGGNS